MRENAVEQRHLNATFHLMCQRIQEQGLLMVLEVEEKDRVESLYRVRQEEVKYQMEN